MLLVLLLEDALHGGVCSHTGGELEQIDVRLRVGHHPRRRVCECVVLGQVILDQAARFVELLLRHDSGSALRGGIGQRYCSGPDPHRHWRRAFHHLHWTTRSTAGFGQE